MFFCSLPYANFNSIYDIMIRATDVDGVSGYMPQFIEEIDFSVLTTVASSQFQVYDFSLKHNYPNPFNACTTIEFEIHQNSYIDIDIYNLQGQLVKNLKSGYLQTGIHRVTWDGTNLNAMKVGSGLYFVYIRGIRPLWYFGTKSDFRFYCTVSCPSSCSECKSNSCYGCGYVMDRENRLLTRRNQITLFGVENTDYDTMELRLIDNYEYLDEDFDIFKSIVIPQDNYQWWNYEIHHNYHHYLYQ